MFKRISVYLLSLCLAFASSFVDVKKSIAQDYDAVTHDLNDPTNFDFRIDGYEPQLYAGSEGAKFADVDSDGKKDIIINGYASTQSRSENGAVWVIYASLLESLSGVTKTLDLSNPDHYNLRFDGARSDEMIGSSRRGVMFGDLDNDGKTDLAIPNWQASYGGVESGSVYVISNTVFGSLAGTGNNIDLNISSNWTLRYDGAAATDRLSVEGIFVADANSDGVDDLLITSPNDDNNARDDSGSLYIASSAQIAAKKINPTGNIVEITDSTAWWLRVDGAAEYDALGNEGNIAVADYSDNGKNDLAIGSIIAAEYSGNIWLVDDTILDDYSGSSNTLDLADSSKYSTLISTSVADAGLYLSKDASTDYDNDGKLDLVLGSYLGTYIIGDDILAANAGPGDSLDLDLVWSGGSPSVEHKNYSLYFNDIYDGGVFADFDGDGVEDMLSADPYHDSLVRTNNGAAFVVYNGIYNLPGDGNDLAVTSNVRNHSIKYHGPDNHYYLGTEKGFDMGDVNGDNRNDILMSSTRASYNGDPFDYTGSVWVIFNFPHTIDITSVTRSGESTLVEATIDATDSITDIAGAVGGLVGGENWYSCQAKDESFDSKNEEISCVIPETNQTNDVVIRAYDVNYSFSLEDGSGGIVDPADDNPNTVDDIVVSIDSGSTVIPLSELPVTGVDTD